MFFKTRICTLFKTLLPIAVECLFEILAIRSQEGEQLLNKSDILDVEATQLLQHSWHRRSVVCQLCGHLISIQGVILLDQTQFRQHILGVALALLL